MSGVDPELPQGWATFLEFTRDYSSFGQNGTGALIEKKGKQEAQSIVSKYIFSLLSCVLAMRKSNAR